jgi:hypothetical protein
MDWSARFPPGLELELEPPPPHAATAAATRSADAARRMRDVDRRPGKSPRLPNFGSDRRQS